jgi:hypothetical protein
MKSFLVVTSILAISLVACAENIESADSNSEAVVITRATERLTSFGPISTFDGFPLSYSDVQGIPLTPCINLADPLCGPLAGPINGGPNFDPSTGPITFPGNFPFEIMYYSSVGKVDVPVPASPPPTGVQPGGRNSTIAAGGGGGNGGGGTTTGFGAHAGTGVIEVIARVFGTFLPTDTVANPADRVTVGRLRIRGDGLAPNHTYTIVHPYGSDTFTTDARGRFKFTDDTALVPNTWTPALQSRVGAYMQWSDAPGGAPNPPDVRHLGDGNVAHAATGAPTGNNFVQVSDDTGILATQDQFTIIGLRR